MDLILSWQGPFSWFGDNGPAVLECDVAESSGIYIWTVPTDAGNLAYYVGQTEAGFANRQYQHFCEYTSGAYGIHDPVEFKRGRRKRVYQGFVYRKPKWKHGREFLKQADSLLQLVPQMLRTMQIWFAEVAADRRTHRRIEGAIIQALYDAPEPACSFQEKGMRRELRRSDEEPIQVEFRPAGLICVFRPNVITNSGRT